MKTIWKFELVVFGRQDIEMPVGAEIIHIGNQNNHICMWAEVNSDNPCENRVFELLTTGHPMPNREDGKYRKHLATVLLDQGMFVAHVYERLVKE